MGGVLNAAEGRQQFGDARGGQRKLVAFRRLQFAQQGRAGGGIAEFRVAQRNALAADRAAARDRPVGNSARRPGGVPQRGVTRASIASQICFSRKMLSKRAISWSPVGEVTLISVR